MSMKRMYKLIFVLSWGIFFFTSCGVSKEGVKENDSMESASIYDIKINSIDGEMLDLSIYKGRKILFVNVASECGFTPQYEGLQELYEKYQESLVIIGAPCNQFGGQESGTHDEIIKFCKLNYGVTFPLTEKIKVKGKEQHELYKWLTVKEENGVEDSEVKWNFHKYLIDENGQLIKSFGSRVKPLSEEITDLL